MTIHQIMELAIEAVKKMSPDEKAITRARLLRQFGLIKSSEGKPS
jgi:hypothetical protein